MYARTISMIMLRSLTFCLLLVFMAPLAYAKPCTPPNAPIALGSQPIDSQVEFCDLPNPTEEVALANVKSVLYRIQTAGYAPSYLMGTFHSDSSALMPLYHKAIALFNEVDSVAVEIVQTPEVQRKAQRGLTLPNDHAGLKSLLSAKTWKDVSQKIAPMLGITPAQANRFTPWGLAVLVQYPPAEVDGVVLDVRIQKQAEAAKLDVLSLESIEDQFSLFQAMPLAQQIQFLELTLQDIDSMPAMHKQLTQLYIAQDLDGIHKMSYALFEQMAQDAPALSHYLEDELIVKRNKRMMRSIMARANSPTFYAVGSLHLSGENGLLNLLMQQGYHITPIMD